MSKRMSSFLPDTVAHVPLKLRIKFKFGISLGAGMQHWGLGPNKVCSSDDPGFRSCFSDSSLLLTHMWHVVLCRACFSSD